MLDILYVKFVYDYPIHQKTSLMILEILECH